MFHVKNPLKKKITIIFNCPLNISLNLPIYKTIHHFLCNNMSHKQNIYKKKSVFKILSTVHLIKTEKNKQIEFIYTKINSENIAKNIITLNMNELNKMCGI